MTAYRRHIKSLFILRRWYRSNGWPTTLLDARLRSAHRP